MTAKAATPKGNKYHLPQAQDQAQITRLEEEMTRAERGMLWWSPVVGV
jgi:hypothetical protein